MVNKSKYSGKNIIILGGSSGIGEALCYKLAAQGANLVIVARSGDKIRKIVKTAQGNHKAIVADLSLRSDIEKLQKSITKLYQKIDLVVFSVGTYEPMNIKNFDIDVATRILNINFASFLLFFDVFRKQFLTKQIKHLAVISSVAGYFGMPNSMTYGASKACLTNFVESLYYELRHYNVKVQLINPGFVKTRLTDKNKFQMPGIISSKQAADIIVKGLLSNKFEIAFPFLFAMMMKIMLMLPYKIRMLILGSKT